MRKVDIEDGNVRPLKEFAECAVIRMERNPDIDEVVQQANNVFEVEYCNLLGYLYELPEGYEYSFDGTIGVRRSDTGTPPMIVLTLHGT